MTQQQRRPTPAPNGTTMRGTVRNLKEAFGFITGDDGVDYFFHKSGLVDGGYQFHELSDGRARGTTADRVEFTTEDGDKGPRGIRVRVLEGAELEDANR